jgi:anti-sigma B factor antagonist
VLDHLSPQPAVSRVRWTGEIDISSVEAFGAAVEEAGTNGGDLCVDLRGTTFIDSTGIARLIGAARAASERGVSMTVLAEQPMMRRAFALLNLECVMCIDPPLSDSDRPMLDDRRT